MKLETTLNIWTSGIVNIPINPSLKDTRYTFFELDNKDISKVRIVLDAYEKYLKSVFVHETINGFHFYNLTPIPKALYGKILRELKYLNPDCPMTTLRIIPNKWEGEQKFWLKGAINGYTPELTDFKRFLDNQNLHMIEQRYQVVRYPFEECPKCKNTRNVKYDPVREIFFCKLCNSQTIGRLKRE